MPNFSLALMQTEYKTKNMRVLLARMIKKHPEWSECTIVTYVVTDTGDTRIMVCPSKDEVRQIFLSPHCRNAHTVRAADKAEESEAA
ncbi:MAG TPA: hypothetical protein VM778_07170 [Gemmatimonadota bacterium]|nr:hypothetical protein [Gemmatimonadota bacterium]